MRLSKEEIQLIIETLELNDVVYEDVKHEILDHIATDIEKHIETDSLDFEKSFYLVFEKWKDALKPTNSTFWLGNYFEGPKIVVDKWVLNSKKQAIKTLVFALFFGVIITLFFQKKHDESTLIIANHFAQALFSSCVLITIFGFYILWRTKTKTTFSRLFKRRSIMVLYPLLLSLGYMKLYLYSDFFYSSLLNNFLPVAFFFYSLLNINMVVEHFKVLKKYKLYN